MTRTNIAPKSANWFTYFPGNYRWSAAVTKILGSANFGAADIGEVDRAGRRLKDRLGDDGAWFEEWSALGDRVRAMAEESDHDGRRLTSASAYLRAMTYYQMAERFAPKDAPAEAAYRTSIRCFHRFAELNDRPRIEVVDVPFEDGKVLPSYFVHAENTDDPEPPCVVFFDGLDITKELQYSRGVPDLVRRGMSCLIVDAPGTGEAIRFQGLHLRHDYEVAGTACLDYLATRTDVDMDRVAVAAVSLGGYYAPRTAAMEPRFAACVAWGAIWDYQATWQRRIDAAFNAAMSVPGDHIKWVLGAETLDEVIEKLEGFKLDGVVQKMRCPFLLTHGAEDEQISMEEAQALFEAVGSEDKTLRVFTAEEGGAQHCQRDYTTIGNNVVHDWLQEKLVGRP